MNFFKPFGCRVWAVKPKPNRDVKFGLLAWDGILLGYKNDYSAYRFYRLEDKQIIPAKHTYFDEADFPMGPAAGCATMPYGVNKMPSFNAACPLPYAKEETDVPPIEDQTQLDLDEQEELAQIKDHLDVLRRRVQQGATGAQPASIPDKADQVSRPIVQQGDPVKPLSSNIDVRNIRTDRRQQAYIVTALVDPKNHKQAMGSPEQKDWREAKLKEISNMLQHKVWVQRPRQEGDLPIPSTWAYRRKLGPENQVI
jgi:hypothetical protein